MPIRDTLARLALPLLGAAAFAAGAALVQVSRKAPVDSEAADRPRPAEARARLAADRIGPVAHLDIPQASEAADASLLQRLRERGL